MAKQEFLVETLQPTEARIIRESHGGDVYIKGIFMQADLQNGNGRVYPLGEIKRAVEVVNESIKRGAPIAGELNHPNHLNIDPERVSHVITEMYMDGGNAIGKAKILADMPMGRIVKTLMEGGVRLGVSSRGSGIVSEGIVSDFSFLTVDVVTTPSAPDAYPTLVREALELAGNGREVVKLAEAVQHDAAAQKYFAEEIKKFIAELTRKN